MLLSSTKIFGSGLARATVCDDVIRQRLTFAQSTHTGAFDRADMNKNVIATACRLDKAEALLGVKLLHCTCVHQVFLSHARRTWRAELRPVFRLVDVGECLKRARGQDLRRKRNSCSASIETIHQQLRDFKKKANGATHHGWCIR